MNTWVAKGLRTMHPYRMTISVLPRASVLGVLVIFSIWLAASPLFAIAPRLDGGHATPGHFVRQDAFGPGLQMDATHDGCDVAMASESSGHIHNGTAHMTCSVQFPAHVSGQSPVKPPSLSAMLPATYDARWQSHTEAPDPLPPRAS